MTTPSDGPLVPCPDGCGGYTTREYLADIAAGKAEHPAVPVAAPVAGATGPVATDQEPLIGNYHYLSYEETFRRALLR
jgi:hypothetical protein